MVGMDLGAIVSEASGDNAWEIESDLAGKAVEHADCQQQMKEQAAEDMRAFLEEKRARREKLRATNRYAKCRAKG
jgi:tryptophanyl-tRNA synthetase